AHSLNTTTTAEDTTFDAVLTENGVLEVVCSNNDEFPIHIAMTEAQLLAITPLFSTSEVQADKVDELNKIMLQISPAIPLSSVGLQDDHYILFGAMSINTIFENIVHELEVQAENTLEVLEAVESLLV
ncbi:MAG TPA: DUF2170 family protein, partial [Gammaproteobacteria bacterium]|nr:DUF2170 family protein [Gammaproteobacteria bacterium]